MLAASAMLKKNIRSRAAAPSFFSFSDIILQAVEVLSLGLPPLVPAGARPSVLLAAQICRGDRPGPRSLLCAPLGRGPGSRIRLRSAERQEQGCWLSCSSAILVDVVCSGCRGGPGSGHRSVRSADRREASVTVIRDHRHRDEYLSPSGRSSSRACGYQAVVPFEHCIGADSAVVGAKLCGEDGNR